MVWNYRVCKKTDLDGSVVYGIHEVYYRHGMVAMWTGSDVGIVGESAGEVRSELLSMMEALEQEVIDLDLPPYVSATDGSADSGRTENQENDADD